MNEKNIIFVNPTADRSIEKVVHRALASCGSLVTVVNDLSSFEEVRARTLPRLALVNYDNADPATGVFVREQFSSAEGVPVVLLSQKREKQHLIELFSHHRLRNLIARNGDLSESELIITTEKLLRDDIFGLDKYLTWGVNVATEVLRDSHEKQEHVSRVSEFVRGLRCDERFVRLAEIVADEMIMNALYDAPVDTKGKARFASLPRTERIELEGKDRASLQYGSDGRYFAIACRDHFGALKAETVISYLRKCFAHDEYQIDTKAGGAGVGFYMIFQSLSQLVINIDPGTMTEIMGLIDIRASYRDTKAKSKSFNIFVKRK